MMGYTNMAHPFNFGDLVYHVLAEDIHMMVSDFSYNRDGGVTVNCNYWLNGDYKSQWFDVKELRCVG